MAFNKHVFPEPVDPYIPIRSPYSIFNLIFVNKGIVILFSFSSSLFS